MPEIVCEGIFLATDFYVYNSYPGILFWGKLYKSFVYKSPLQSNYFLKQDQICNIEGLFKSHEQMKEESKLIC